MNTLSNNVKKAIENQGIDEALIVIVDAVAKIIDQLAKIDKRLDSLESK